MKQKIQIVLIVAFVVAGIRLAWIFYERHQAAVQPARKEAPLNPDYYVTPKKLYFYDLKTAKQQLPQQPVWVKVGYAYSYYPYNEVTRRADLSDEAGKLLPLQNLQFKDAIAQPMPGKPRERQVLAVFEQDGKSYAAPIGSDKGQDYYQFYANDMLLIQDPHDLYKHWPVDVWQAIDQHQVKPGMSELQTGFALGIGILEPGSDDIDRTLDYPNGGKPLTISFHHDKAIAIRPGRAS